MTHSKGRKKMNIKQTITVATGSVLWLAISTGFPKPPARGGGHMQRGIELAQQKHYDAAAAEFTKQIEANPKDPRGYMNRGTACRQGGVAAEAASDIEGAAKRFTSAVADFTKVIELSPKNAEGYLERGQTECILKQYDPALADLNKALELKPDDAVALKFRGAAEIGLSQWDKAVADLTAAIQKDPNDLFSYDRRAWANRNLKRYDAAIADYAFLLEKNPNDTEALTKRGYTYTAMGEYEKAIADYQAVLKLNPQDNNTFQRLQYAQSMLAAKNAPPPPLGTATPISTPENPGLVTPLNIVIAVGALIGIAVIVRLLTRGKEEHTSHRIR
jgi:tetratricopeptide (TPR) repeat protein